MRDHEPTTVIFDLDGVLVDSYEVMREAFTAAYAEVVGEGKPPFEEYRKYMGRYFPEIMEIMGLPLEMEEPFVRESYRLAHRVQLYPGISGMLNTLNSAGLRLAVATGKRGSRARSLLDGLGVLPMFAHVTESDEVSRPKPAPDIVLHILNVLGVRPDEAMMIGDATVDLASARAADVTAVAALWGVTNPSPVLDAGPDLVLHEPADLLPHIRNMPFAGKGEPRRGVG
jgi:AHBA synthesis associated protein